MVMPEQHRLLSRTKAQTHGLGLSFIQCKCNYRTIFFCATMVTCRNFRAILEENSSWFALGEIESFIIQNTVAGRRSKRLGHSSIHQIWTWSSKLSPRESWEKNCAMLKLIVLATEKSNFSNKASVIPNLINIFQYILSPLYHFIAC